VSLLVVPALYAYFDTLAKWGRNVMRTARRSAPSSSGAALAGTAAQSRK